MNLPPVVIVHFFWSAVILSAGFVVHRKAKKTGLDTLKDFRNFFIAWGGLFFGVMASGWTLGLYLNNQTILSLAYTAPHVFPYIAIGYLWKVQAGIQFPEYQKYFYVFVAYGVGLATFGIFDMPTVLREGNMLIFGPESLFGLGQQIGTTVAVGIVSSVSAYSAYLNSGQNRLKMGLISLGTLLILIAAIGYNMGTPTGNTIGAIGNASFILSFLAAISLDRIAQVVEAVNDKL